MTRYVGHPVALDRVVARTPTLTVGLGRVVVDPEGVALELVAQERRLPRDRVRLAVSDELFVRRPGPPPSTPSTPGFAAMPAGVEQGGGSGRGGWSRGDWYVRGLPATGDLELVVVAHSHDVDVVVRLDGDVLRAAAGRATALWPDA